MKPKLLIDVRYVLLWRSAASFEADVEKLWGEISRRCHQSLKRTIYQDVVSHLKSVYKPFSTALESWLLLVSCLSESQLNSQEANEVLSLVFQHPQSSKDPFYYEKCDSLFTGGDLKNLKELYDVYLLTVGEDPVEDVMLRAFVNFLWNTPLCDPTELRKLFAPSSSDAGEDIFFVSADVARMKPFFATVASQARKFDFVRRFIKFESALLERQTRLAFDAAANEEGVMWQVMFSLRFLGLRLQILRAVNRGLVTFDDFSVIGLYLEPEDYHNLVRSRLAADYLPLLFFFHDPAGIRLHPRFALLIFKNPRIFIENGFDRQRWAEYGPFLEERLWGSQPRGAAVICTNHLVAHLTFFRSLMLPFVREVACRPGLQTHIAAAMPGYTFENLPFFCFAGTDVEEFLAQMHAQGLQFPIIIKPDPSNKALSAQAHVMMQVRSAAGLAELFAQRPAVLSEQTQVAQQLVKCEEVLKGYVYFGKVRACWHNGLAPAVEAWKVVRTSDLKETRPKPVEPQHIALLTVLEQELRPWELGNYGLDIVIDESKRAVHIIDINPTILNWTKSLSVGEARSTFLSAIAAAEAERG